jgi:CHRD domain
VRFKRLALLVVLAGAFAASVATAATMHPKLAAHLSGMGEHGIVNLQVKPKSNQVCWTFDLPTTKNVTATSIHTGTSKVVVLKLGKTYTARGCAKADPMVVEHLETKPATYWVFVDTKGHPGELRGKLFAGMAHM